MFLLCHNRGEAKGCPNLVDAEARHLEMVCDVLAPSYFGSAENHTGL